MYPHPVSPEDFDEILRGGARLLGVDEKEKASLEYKLLFETTVSRQSMKIATRLLVESKRDAMFSEALQMASQIHASSAVVDGRARFGYDDAVEVLGIAVADCGWVETRANGIREIMRKSKRYCRSIRMRLRGSPSG